MSDKRSSAGPLQGLFNQLADDVLSLSDEELRVEIREDGGSLADYSARFERALSGPSAQLRAGRSFSSGVPVAAVPFSRQSLRRFPSVEKMDDPYGDSRRRSRRVVRYRGAIAELMDLLPEFEEAPFTASPVMQPNPDRRLVVRKPGSLWTDMAVGSVSNAYALVQHREAVQVCLRGLERQNFRRDELRGELTSSAFGEWMNFTLVLPEEYGFVDNYGHRLDFRCEVANSVDGSSPLQFWFDWFRQICSNGFVVRESRNRSQRRLHRSGLTLNEVEQRVFWGLEDALRDGLSLGRFLRRWQENPVSERAVAAWVDEPLQKEWGLHAAARVYSICYSGHDTGFEVGASGRPTLLAFAAAPGARVPGSPVVAGTAYDVAQAMSWVASRNQNTDERARRQAQIPGLLDRLQAA